MLKFVYGKSKSKKLHCARILYGSVLFITNLPKPQLGEMYAGAQDVVPYFTIVQKFKHKVLLEYLNKPSLTMLYFVLRTGDASIN